MPSVGYRHIWQLTSGTFGGKGKGPQGGLWDLGVTSTSSAGKGTLRIYIYYIYILNVYTI